jgi:ELWxxDGT repeat protein
VFHSRSLTLWPWILAPLAAAQTGPEAISLGQLEPSGLSADVFDAPRATVGGWTYSASGSSWPSQQGSYLARFDATAGGAVEVVAQLGGEYGDFPSQFTAFGSLLLFTADDGEHGFELWRSDGTEAGTQLVLDLAPGKLPGISRAGYSREPLLTVDGLAFFIGTGADGVRTLYRTDGTAPGTFALEPGLAMAAEAVESYADLGGEHYALTGDRLVRFDGDGLDVVPVNATNLDDLRSFGGHLYFRAEGAEGAELWRSDGLTAAPFVDVRPGPDGSAPDALTVYGGRLWFTADDGVHGRELWSTDGTVAGTQLLLDLAPGSANGVGERTYPTRFITQFDGRLWFAGRVADSYRVWSSDGTAAGTQPLFGGGGGPEVQPFGDGFREPSVGGTHLAFSGQLAGDWGLWWTDGTEPGTSEVDGDGSYHRSIAYLGDGSITYRKNSADLWRISPLGAASAFVSGSLPSPFPMDGYPRLDHFTALGSSLLLVGDDGLRGREWWSVGDSGFESLGEFYPGPSSASPSTLDLYDVEIPAVEFRGELFILATESDGMALWKMDGSAPGTERLAGYPHPFIHPEEAEYIDTHAAALDDVLVFAAPSLAAYKFSLMSTDGTAAGTQVLAGTNIDLSNFKRLGSKVLFSAFDAVGNKSGIYATDGLPGGTAKISDSPILGAWTETLVCGGFYYYTARALGDAEFTLWRSDGTAAGTLPVVPAGTPGRPIEPYHLACDGDRLVFSALDESGALHLWESDGSAAGTQKLPGPSLGDEFYDVREVLTLNGQVLYVMDGLLYRSTETGSLTPAWPFNWRVADEQTPGRGNDRLGSRRIVWVVQIQSSQDALLVTTEGTSTSATILAELGDVFSLSDPPNVRLVGGYLYFDSGLPDSDGQLHKLWPGATAQAFGNSCGAAESLPALSATDPVLGATCSIELRDALPATPALVFLGPDAAPQHLASGCTLYTDLLSPELVATGVTDATGAWISGDLPIPADPQLQGATGVLQALLLPTAGAPAGFQLSNGVFIGLGD